MVLLVWTSIPSGGLLWMQQEHAAEGASDSIGESIKKKNNITVMVNCRHGDQHHACMQPSHGQYYSKQSQASLT